MSSYPLKHTTQDGSYKKVVFAKYASWHILQIQIYDNYPAKYSCFTKQLFIFPVTKHISQSNHDTSLAFKWI